MSQHILNLNRSHYEHHEKYMKWCDENIGKGGWDVFGRHALPDDFNWSVGCMFGTCNYHFRTESDMLKFQEFVSTVM